MRMSLLQRLRKLQPVFAKKTTDMHSGPSAKLASSAPAVAEAGTAARAKKREGHYTCRYGNEQDLKSIARLFRSHNYGPATVEWLRWKYFENPDGQARIFLGLDTNGAVVAIRVHMPRLFTSKKHGTFEVRQSVDWFVAEANRGTGVYSQLREFSRLTRDYPIIGFPNKRSRLITKTYPGDVRIYYPIDEWLFPITAERFVGKESHGYTNSLTDRFLKSYSVAWLGRLPKTVRMEPLKRFQKDYALNTDAIFGFRSAEYLNWRFIDNPVRSFFATEFFEGSRSLGYCVYNFEGSFVKIYDLVLNSRTRACLRLLVEHLRQNLISHIVFKSVGFNMRKYGFIRTGSPGDLDTLNTPRGKWMITLADKD